MRAVKEAFETLRSAGLGPDARSAFGAVLDCVMNEFDAGHMRWAERATYRYLVERLAGDQPLIPKSQPSAESFDLEDPEGASCYLKGETETPQALQTAGIAVGSGVDLGEFNSEADATLIAPAVLISAADVAALIEKGVGAVIKRAMVSNRAEPCPPFRVHYWI